RALLRLGASADGAQERNCIRMPGATEGSLEPAPAGTAPFRSPGYPLGDSARGILPYLIGMGALALALGLFSALPAAAHPTDEAGVYHYQFVEVKPGKLSLQEAFTVGGLV